MHDGASIIGLCEQMCIVERTCSSTNKELEEGLTFTLDFPICVRLCSVCVRL